MLTIGNGVTLWMVASALSLAVRRPTDGNGYSVRLMLVVGSPVVFMAMVFFSFFQARDPNLQYTYDASSLAKVALLSLTLVVQLYWVLRLFGSSIRWLQRTLGRRLAT